MWLAGAAGARGLGHGHLLGTCRRILARSSSTAAAGKAATGARKEEEESLLETQSGALYKDESVHTPAVIKKLGWDPESLRVKDATNFNRWALIPAATLNHMCIGSIFAWSIFNTPLTRLSGVVAPAANDWLLGDVTVTFSLVMGGFAWGAVFGNRLDTYGPRASCLLGATALASGYICAGFSASIESLPLLYVAGTVWGISNGWAYVPPVSTLVRWFPEKKGFASGCAILGYGGGAMLTTSLYGPLTETFRKVPEYAGPADSLDFVNQDGKLFLDSAEGLREVVVATKLDLQSAGLAEIADAGAYFVGTGSTGVAEVFTALGLGYGLTMVATSMMFRLPPHGYAEAMQSRIEAETQMAAPLPAGAGATPEDAQEDKKPVTVPNITPAESMQTHHFYLMFLGFGLSITPAYGLISSGKLMMAETFGSNLPNIVTAGFTSSFVAAMSMANLSGRLFWPTASDVLARYSGGNPFYARKNTYLAMWALSPLCYAGVYWGVHECVREPSVLPLAVFTGSFLTLLTSFGGTTASRPALMSDAYGERSMAVLTARQLSVVLPAAFLGPQIVAHCREASTHSAIEELSTHVDDGAFHHAFGADKNVLPELIESKTVTISRLMDLVPAGVQDPTPFLYDNAIVVLGGFSAAALCTKMMLTPPYKPRK
ncbi:Monocarboxylate transporter 14 [Hondaea fermentalgiana]|uniref:Monocarboxylate transporter 14 n=1 Tax=Hondaea fermentalgiana TaxID=2315210 RepID=A0A2R5GVL0_9STRA|nr:Monocarboxylate transporter 14 [Hondaea fermentalgiana]|eukprot:GBG33808.1 Monocarboxylate transporter 14 [Hondaea fermentalgiana]